jgi:hypothetical protein
MERSCLSRHFLYNGSRLWFCFTSGLHCVAMPCSESCFEMSWIEFGECRWKLFRVMCSEYMECWRACEFMLQSSVQVGAAFRKSLWCWNPRRHTRNENFITSKRRVQCPSKRSIFILDVVVQSSAYIRLLTKCFNEPARNFCCRSLEFDPDRRYILTTIANC